MSNRTKNLQYFVGKVCTIHTLSINRSYNDQTALVYFTGTIELIDEDSLFLRQLNGLRSYFNLYYVVTIAEEQTLDPSKEEDAKAINEMKEVKQTQYVDPVATSKLLSQFRSIPK